jgi:hypothetical protein
MLYRGMDRAQLDAAYNHSAAVSERDAIVADWAARSARVRREYAGHLGLAYGETSREQLDLFLAANSQAPTLAFIHGGYWQIADLAKESFAFFAEGLLPLGINLAVIEYTLAPAARLDRIVAEVRRSVRWLAEHLAGYGADPSRLYVAGHSAGGHLTAMTMALAEGDAGKPRHQHGRNAEFAGDLDGVQGTGAAKGEQGEIARIVPLLDRHQADRVRKLIGGDGQDRRRGRGRIQAERRADLFVDGGGDRLCRR